MFDVTEREAVSPHSLCLHSGAEDAIYPAHEDASFVGRVDRGLRTNQTETVWSTAAFHDRQHQLVSPLLLLPSNRDEVGHDEKVLMSFVCFCLTELKHDTQALDVSLAPLTLCHWSAMNPPFWYFVFLEMEDSFVGCIWRTLTSLVLLLWCNRPLNAAFEGCSPWIETQLLTCQCCFDNTKKNK